MYIQPAYYWKARDGSPRSRGRFLILMQEEGAKGWTQIKALVRIIERRQVCGKPIGVLKSLGHEIALIGAYGNQGDAVQVPMEVYGSGQTMPIDLQEAWKANPGNNHAGDEAKEILRWALDNFPERGRRRFGA